MCSLTIDEKHEFLGVTSQFKLMPNLSVKNVSKRYGPVQALENVSVEFLEGEIHAVLGENGAGKSTLMHILSGFTNPDKGSVLLDGIPIPLGEAFACKRLGIAMIHQHFTLVPEFTVQENFALARLDSPFCLADEGTLAKDAISTANSLGWKIDPTVRVSQLSVGAQQRIEILKASSGDASVLIFDEPTAVLAADEVEDLFRVLRQLKATGKCVILIAHKLSEVLSIADRITVLRKGHLIATEMRADVNEAQLADWMVGEMPEREIRTGASLQSPGLKVTHLSVKGDRGESAVNQVDFEIHQGEVVGFGGVDGNGQLELVEFLAGVRTMASGSCEWEGKPISESNVRIGYIPQDRQNDGLALGMSVLDNMMVSTFQREDLWNRTLLRFKAASEWVKSLIQEYSIKASNPGQRVGSLSGGNQQKVVVSRTLDNKPTLLVVASPGRGLDIKATQYVHDQILRARDQGAAVALFTTDLDELYRLSDRSYFMVSGRIQEDRGALSMVRG